jgi:AmmeMemoRadiSam system protein B
MKAFLFFLMFVQVVFIGAPAVSAERADPSILGGIVPHHDIAVDIMARFYNKLSRKSEVKRVYLLSPDHFRRARNWAAVCDIDWTTDSRTLCADTDAISELQSLKIVEVRSDMFRGEHGITVHIPLVARYFGDAKVVPLVLRPDIPDVALLMLREKLKTIAGSGDLIILSMDFSHYKTPEAMASEDIRSIEVLTKMNIPGLMGLDIDARRAAALTTLMFKDRGAKRGELLERSDSSVILGRRVESGTSYATFLYRSEN